MKFRRNLRSRMFRGFRISAHDSARRVDRWPAWKRNSALAKHISLLK